MNKKHRKFLSIISFLLIVVALSAMAIIMVNQNRSILAYEENHLGHLASSIDNNIHTALHAREETLSRFLSRNSVKSLEKEWILDSSNTEYADTVSSELLQNELTKAVLILKDGQIVYASDGKTNINLDKYTENNGLLPFENEKGEVGLLIVSDEDEYKVRVGLSINLRTFYREIISRETAEENWILLLDADSQIMMHYQNSQVLVDPIDAVTGATCGPDGIELIKNIQLSENFGSGKYMYWDKIKKLEHTAYLTVLPSAQTSNGFFAVGVATQMDEKESLINNSTMGYVIATITLMIGAVIIAWIVRKDKIVNKENEEELIILREKNEQMRELEKKHSELAHIERLETIGTLTSSISHEFNNLLTPIMADSALALDKITDEDAELGEYLETIYNSSTKAKRLVSRLSYLSRKSGDDEKSLVDIGQTVLKALDSASPIKPASVSTSVNCEEGLNVFANELLIHQMILNLIINAYQAMDGLKGLLSVTAKAVDDTVVIEVKDTGKGIPKELLDKIFDPFFTTKGSGKGTGLGLAICKQIAEDNGGSISLTSEENVGTSFIVTFPKP